jgi:hypothetical protein
MAVSARVVPDSARPFGHARIVLAGLAQHPADARFGLMREGYAAAHLGPAGWQMGEVLLNPLAVEPEGSGIALVVGPAVCRHLEPGPVTLRLPGAGVETTLFWPASVAVFDEGSATIAIGLRRPPVEPPRRTEGEGPNAAPPPPPPPAPPPPSPPTTDRRSLAAWLVVAVLILAAGAAGAWWYLHRPAPPPPAPAPAAAAAWPEGTDHLTPAEVVLRAPDAAGILAVALRRQQRGRHDDALVLFEEAADRGVAPALTALARLYDPVGFQPGRPFSSPDPRLAALYYRRAEQAGDTQASAPRAALRDYLQREADAGNATARDALREFWP